MEITGRLTADAVVRTVSADRKVVGFTLALNDSYVKDGERVDQAVFVDCSYWRNTGLSGYLKKGGLVQVYGRIGVNAYIARDGEAKGQITFHVSEVKLFGGSSSASDKQQRRGQQENVASDEDRQQHNADFADVDTTQSQKGDLPF